MIFLKASSLSLFLFCGTQAIKYPVGITNCHYSQWFDKAPERAMVASSGAVEIMLAMGLADRVIHSSWVKEVWEPLMEDFNKFKHYDKYPSAQDLMDSKPDMIYATYSSAFEDPSDPGRVVDGARLNYTEALGLTKNCSVLIESNSYGANKVYCRDEIHEANINTYLASSYCEYAEHRPKEVSVDVLYQEIWDIAIIFDAIDNARNLVTGIEDHFEQALAISQDLGSNNEAVDPIRVFWLDIFSSKSRPEEKRPFVGACCGGPQIVLDKAGAVNVFADQGLEDRRIWDRVEWADVIETDPDLIVLIELGTESAAEKLYKLCSDPELSKLRAVQERQFLVLPFAASNVGVRLGAAAYNMAEAIAALTRGSYLNALEFTQNSETSEAVSLSGLKVWTTLPTWNGTDLETFCPGPHKNIDILNKTEIAMRKKEEIVIREEIGIQKGEEISKNENMKESNSSTTGLESWAIALIAIFGLVAVGLALFLVKVVQKEKAGEPMFRAIVREGGTSA